MNVCGNIINKTVTIIVEKRKVKKITTYLIAITAFAIPVKLYFTPPTDYDAGPMMAYNFLFFYPLAFLSIILSIIVIFRLKFFKKDLGSLFLLIIAVIPSIRLIFLILYNIIRISNEPPYDLNIELHNNTVKLKINDTLDVNLYGYTNKISENNEITLFKKINVVPYINQKYSFKDGGSFYSDSENYDVYYKVRNDSLFLYSVDVDFSFFNKQRIQLPIMIKQNELLNESSKELEIEGYKK